MNSITISDESLYEDSDDIKIEQQSNRNTEVLSKKYDLEYKDASHQQDINNLSESSFILDISKDVLNITNLPKFFNFILKTTTKHFSSLKTLKSSDEIRKSQYLTELFIRSKSLADNHHLNIDNLDELIVLCDISSPKEILCSNSTMKNFKNIDHEVGKINELLNLNIVTNEDIQDSHTNFSLGGVLNTTQMYLNSLPAPNYKFLKTITSSFVKLHDSLLNINKLKNLIQALITKSYEEHDNFSSKGYCNMSLYEPLNNECKINQIIEKILNVIDINDVSSNLNTQVKVKGSFHSFINTSLENIESEIQRIIQQILSVDSKIALNKQNNNPNILENNLENVGVFKINRSQKINSKDDIFNLFKKSNIKRLKNSDSSQKDLNNKIIFIGTTKSHFIFTFTDIKILRESIVNLQKLKCIIELFHLQKLNRLLFHDETNERDLNESYCTVLNNMSKCIVNIDLYYSYAKSGFNNIMVYDRKICVKTLSHNDLSESIHNIFLQTGVLLCNNPIISLKRFYHPLIEECIENDFIPVNTYNNSENSNDICGCDTKYDNLNNFITLSGPNTSGKSTILRSISLIVYLSHLGAPVPIYNYDSVQFLSYIPLFDYIRVRIGSDDDNEKGESSFMKEMVELSDIVNVVNSEKREEVLDINYRFPINNYISTTKLQNLKVKNICYKLILIDELGRGTSIVDGISISMAIRDFLIGKRDVITLFVTHFEELLVGDSENSKDYSLMNDKEPNSMNFSGIYYYLNNFRLTIGTDKSYGIECASKSGFPADVIKDCYYFLNMK